MFVGEQGRSEQMARPASKRHFEENCEKQKDDEPQWSLEKDNENSGEQELRC